MIDRSLGSSYIQCYLSLSEEIKINFTRSEYESEKKQHSK